MNPNPTPSSNDRAAYVEKQSFQLRDLEEQMDRLRTEIEATGSAPDREKVEEVRGMMARLRTQLDTLRTSSDAAWHDLVTGVEKAYDDIKAALARARAEFDRD